MKTITRLFLLLLLVVLLACPSSFAEDGFGDTNSSPAERRLVARPPEVSLEAAARRLPRLYSLLVGWRGDLVLERYYNGRGPTRVANIKSASKTVLSALVGIAIDRGLIQHVRQPIGGLFEESA
jgi:CubicO group peptidase (beta-lactamase class C family)